MNWIVEWGELFKHALNFMHFRPCVVEIKRVVSLG